MKIVTKNKHVTFGTETNHLEMDNGDIITGCTEFKYLVSIFTKEGRYTKNIRHRVTQTGKNNRCIKWGMVVIGSDKNRKLTIYCSVVRSVQMYRAETDGLLQRG